MSVRSISSLKRFRNSSGYVFRSLQPFSCFLKSNWRHNFGHTIIGSGVKLYQLSVLYGTHVYFAATAAIRRL